MSDLTIGVTTVSFSSDPELIRRLEEAVKAPVLINEARKRFTPEALLAFLEPCDGAIVGLDRIDDSVLDACPKLRVVSKYGVGLDNVDLEACARRGVKVVYPKGVNKRSVSEQTLGFMLSLGRNLFVTSAMLKRGEWSKNGGWQLSDKTVGVIGVGNIGKDLVTLLKPFGCRILVNDIIDQSGYYAEHGLEERSKEEIFASADFVTIHTPKTELTANMIDERVLGMMKPTAYLINTARGGIVNEADLKTALVGGQIAGAALDVYTVEPPADREFVALENFICTPHIGGNAREAVEAMAVAAMDNLVQGLGL